MGLDLLSGALPGQGLYYLEEDPVLIPSREGTGGERGEGAALLLQLWEQKSVRAL